MKLTLTRIAYGVLFSESCVFPKRVSRGHRFESYLFFP
nr:MAG TPA: hypothetical protein [Caudoviricetes sp.]DAU40794.1 MAG TPA: hypothetical protein [Caudoviricetes sp.]